MNIQKLKNKIIAKNSSGDGLLPMKQGEKQESKKSDNQKNEELCNFIKNAFIADGEVLMIESEKPLKLKVWFLVKDSKRGDFAVGIKTLTKKGE